MEYAVIKHQTFSEIEALLYTAQNTVAEMMIGAAQNSAAGSVDLPICNFVDITGMLRTLAEEVDRMRQEDHGASLSRATGGAIMREAWTELLCAVPTMGSSSLADVLAPAELAEIAAAVIVTLPAQGAPASARPVAPHLPAQTTTDVIDDRFLERLFAAHARQAA